MMIKMMIMVLMTMIVEPCCALSLCFIWFYEILVSRLFMAINTNQVISLYLYTSQVTKTSCMCH